MINGPKEIFCEVDGLNQFIPITFRDEDHLNHVISRIVSAVGRRVDESSPIVDARLKDGSRVNVILPPVSLKGPAVSIRKFTQKIRRNELIEKKSIARWMLEFLESAVMARINIIVSGGTGAGKTTLLNALSEAIPPMERLVTVEDSAELQISQKNIVTLETRPPNLEGKGEITQRDLVKNSLRMKPDRIIVGECRSGEAFDMLQAMNTGHEGSLTTIHANSPREAMSRLQDLILMADVGMTEASVRNHIAAARPIVIQVLRQSDGVRRVTHISEVTGKQSDVISMQDIFSFNSRGVDSEGRIRGAFEGHGIVPQCMSQIKLAGRDFEAGFWQQKMEV
jgi:pilus assembly protein CpaF